MLPQVTPLERQWERRLRREGMPAEPRLLTARRPGQAGDPRGAVVSLSVVREVAAAEVVAPLDGFRAATWRLPNCDLRRFLLVYADLGYVRPAARRVGIHWTTAYEWLKEFARWREENGC